MPDWLDQLLIFGVACGYMLIVVCLTLGVMAFVNWLRQFH